MKKTFALFIFMLMSISAFAASADQILASFSALQSYRADFKQVTEIEGFGADEYSGKIYVVNKYKALWDYDFPYRQFYLFTNDKVDYYDSETKQLMRQKNIEGNQNAITRLMLDIGNIKENFQVQQINDYTLNLIPLSDIGVQFVTFEVDGNRISKVTSKDPAGNGTEVTFSNVQVNVPIEEKVFEPAVPEGTEVFEY
jgi:outer membrane lipoprotein carrier protein